MDYLKTGSSKRSSSTLRRRSPQYIRYGVSVWSVQLDSLIVGLFFSAYASATSAPVVGASAAVGLPYDIEPKENPLSIVPTTAKENAVEGSTSDVNDLRTVGSPIEVTVQGPPPGPPLGTKDTSVPSSVIRRERLVGAGLQPQDVLRTQPGVTVTESGGFGSPATAAIRGATAADTPIYLGGVRLNDDVGGTADLSLVPLWLIDRVEIYRGHAPLDADRLAPGGAIFFEPRRPTKAMGGVGYYGGSWGTSKGWAYAGDRVGRFSGLVGVSVDRAENRYSFLNDHGTLFNLDNATRDYRRNADERTVEAWGLGRVDFGKGVSFDILTNGIVREQGVPRLALVQSRKAREESSRILLSATLRVPLDAAERYVLLSRTSFLNGRAEYDDPVYELNLRTSNLTVSGKRVEQTLDATLDVSDSVRLHPAVNLAEERIEREPDDIPLGRTHREYVRTAVGATYSPLAWVTLSALAAGECHHTGVEKGSSCDSLEPTGRAGFEIGSERLRVLANFGRYVRVPTLGEMYGVSGALHGNPDLTAETSQSVDIGVRARTGKGPLWQGAYVDAFAFRRWAEGLIAYRRAGQGFMVPYNVGQVQISGVEILTGLKLNRIVQTEVSTTLLDPRDTTPGRTESNNVLPYRSRLIVAPRVRADWTRPSSTRNGVSGLGAEVRLLYQSSRFADPGGLGVIEQQTTVDIESHLSFFRGLLTLRGRVSDLFDSKRTDYIGYPLPGRSVYFGLEATW